ncbi:MAG: hypothetical protein CL908_15095 [Deltaproteobacteria bacterium]|nr:hypothetical protein [Deltaproteobacteria bacterium]
MSSTLNAAHTGNRNYRLFVAEPFQAEATRAGLRAATGFDAIMAGVESVPGGRGEHRVVALEGRRGMGQRIRLRPLRHGGWLGGLLGDRFLTPGRVFRELDLWLVLRARGAALPDPVLAVARRRRGFWRSALGAIDLDKALDGRAWLASKPARADLTRCARGFARSLRALHEAGALHGDLQLRNVLVEIREGELHCLFIDLDRTTLHRALTPVQRMRELMRLARSCEKLGHSELLAPPSRLPGIVLSAYCGTERDLLRAMQRCLPAESRRIRRHRIAWRIGRLLSCATMWLLLAGGLACSPNADDRSVSKPDVRWSMLAVGDTGRRRSVSEFFEGQFAVAGAMAREAEHEPIDAFALLGDNFYWHGLDREHLVERIRENLVHPYCPFLALSGPRSSEVADACLTEPAARRPVPIYAVLGNHDLELPESAALHRNALPDFLPQWRTSRGLASYFEVAEGVSLVLFESEPAIRDPEAMKRALRESIRAAKGPWRILITHRPIATDDRGGVPLGGYPIWVREGIAEAGRPVQLVLTGHHHSLQAFELERPSPLLQIGVGSGARATPPLASDHPAARFGALALGFARVDLLEAGEGGAERLSASIFEAPRWPWLGMFQPHRLRARFEVDILGRVIRSDLR